MALFAEPVFSGLDNPFHYGRVAARLLTALVLGGFLGYEREREGKAAGLRTHMLVALGSALFVIAPLEAGISRDQLSRVIQGLTMGIGFLGAGTIIKEGQHIKGLTTAANIWLTAAVGAAVGLGWVWPAAFAVLLAWVVLLGLQWIEPWIDRRPGP